MTCLGVNGAFSGCSNGEISSPEPLPPMVDPNELVDPGGRDPGSLHPDVLGPDVLEIDPLDSEPLGLGPLGEASVPPPWFGRGGGFSWSSSPSVSASPKSGIPCNSSR